MRWRDHRRDRTSPALVSSALPRDVDRGNRTPGEPTLDGCLCGAQEWLTVTPNEQDYYEASERQAHAEATYERLFGPRDKGAPDNDPELMEILRRFIFGDVFDTGVLDDQTRELITVTVLACLQTLPQLKSHTAAALNVGVQPIEIREAIYQLAPFIGFPRTLNAVATVNDVFRAQDIQLPLPVQGRVSDADRYPEGLAEQAPLYGNEIKDNLADLPEPFNELLPRFLTEFCFGDFYTRGGLTLSQRELLVLCALAAIGDTSAQLGPHGRACIEVGNSKTVMVAALVHCFPYIGFPRAVAAIRAVKNL
jgi:4-carboxymuconolactone decarboxylase